MAVTSDVLKGTLTGGSTVDTLRTASNNAEQVTVWFRNYSVSTVVVSIYLNGDTSDDIIANVELQPEGGSCSMDFGLGDTDNVRASTADADAINWFISEVINP